MSPYAYGTWAFERGYIFVRYRGHSVEDGPWYYLHLEHSEDVANLRNRFVVEVLLLDGKFTLAWHLLFQPSRIEFPSENIALEISALLGVVGFVTPLAAGADGVPMWGFRSATPEER